MNLLPVIAIIIDSDQTGKEKTNLKKYLKNKIIKLIYVSDLNHC